MPKLYWDEYTYDEIESKIKENPLVILPIGSVEAHGHHLPLGTDMFQPLWIAEEVARRFDAIILPPIHYGWTDSLASFPGTISIGFETLRNLVADILQTVVKQGVKRILVLSGHASSNHMAALRLACEKVARGNEDVKIMLLSDYYLAYEYSGKEISHRDGISRIPEDDSHAGVIETSRIMAIRPELVKENVKFEKKETDKYMVIPDYRKIVPYATFSDPKGSSASLGEKLNEIILEALVSMLRDNMNL